MPISTHKLLLQLHLRLEELVILPTELSTLLESSWTSGAFAHLKRLEIPVGSLSRPEFQHLWMRCWGTTYLHMFDPGFGFGNRRLTEDDFEVTED